MTSWPDLAVLELLAGVADTGSLGAAARALGQAQPNASRAVARLERQLGLVLLVRSHRGSVLSSAGEELVAAARPLLEEATRWQVRVDALSQGARSVLEFAASQTVAEYLAPGWVATMHARLPEVEVSMRVTNSTTVAALVLTQQVAVGFVEAPDVPSSLACRTVHTDRLCVVVDPTHRWARRRRPLRLDELAGASLVVRELGSGTRETLDAALAAALGPDHGARAAMMLSSNAAVLGACAAGAGPAVLSELAVRQAAAEGRVVQVPLEHPELLARELRAVWQGPRPSPAAGELVRIAAGA